MLGRLESVPESKWEVEEVIDQVSQAHNSMVRKDGFSPNQHVLGAEMRMPSTLLEGGLDEARASALAVGERGYERHREIRRAARKAYRPGSGELLSTEHGQSCQACSRGTWCISGGRLKER